MILEIEPLPYKLGLNAEELDSGPIRLNLTLYDVKEAIFKGKNIEAILETNYIDVNPNLHAKKKVRKQLIKVCYALVGRRCPPHILFNNKALIEQRVKDVMRSTVLEEKIKQIRLLSKFHNNH